MLLSKKRFFEHFIKLYKKSNSNNLYRKQIQDYIHTIKIPKIEYSNNYAISCFVKRIPDNSILHLSINNSIRIVNYLGLPNRSISVYSNIGTHGIDGCLSSFIGQALTTEELCFLIIGDLSFFYDMGAMRIRHLPDSARILMINNKGGGEFHYSTTLKNDPTMDIHTSAYHENIAEGWIKSLGYKYIAVHKHDEYNAALDVFFDKSIKRPVFIEFFSDMETDATITHEIENRNKTLSRKEKIKANVKDAAHKLLSGESIEKIKKIMKQ